MKLNNKVFLYYKLLNSLFTGLSIGIMFTIYQPLDPSIYSIGGIFLAIGMLIIAPFYDRLLDIKNFFRISLIVEIIMLLTIITFLIFGYSLASALLIYCGYQITFVFGGYLVRAETLVAKEKEFLTKIDVTKQIGYLVGLALSYLYYQTLKYGFAISETKVQINILHYFLISLQTLIIVLVLASFTKK